MKLEPPTKAMKQARHTATEREVFDRLIPLIQEVTAAPPERICLESGLVEDLGAESLDLLDLSFLIEETFGVTLRPDEFEQRVKERIGGGVFAEDGFLTDAALEELRRLLPEVPGEKLRPPLARQALPSILNVAVVVHLIQRKLDQQASGAEASHA
jgi:acyl carrier protein